ncbi:MAG: hypothetical protein IKM30_05000 [Oscillospiraceae bacterium]|nr:hypothetical protein [Oscillospiraceae bacterium]
MAHFPFSERPDLLVFTCTHVLEEGRPVTLVCHHFSDNAWEFLCDCAHTDEEALVISIGELCKMDPALHLLSDLPVGACAVRESPAHAWQYGRIDGEDFYPAAESRMK